MSGSPRAFAARRADRAERRTLEVLGVLWALAIAGVAGAQEAAPDTAPPASPPPSLPEPPPTEAAPAPDTVTAPDTVAAPDTWGSAEPAAAPEAAPNTAAPRAPLEIPKLPADCRCSVDAPRTGAVRYTLEGIDVRGNTRTERRVILRYVPFKPGDVFDVDDSEVQLTRYRLLGTGFFRDVQFSLRKGSERGMVVLVIDVRERNTIVVNDILMGLSGDSDTNGTTRPLNAYAGLDVAETNLAGTGITLGAAIAVGTEQQLGLRMRFLDPAFAGTSWMFGGSLLYNDASDYFGNAKVLTGSTGSRTYQNSAEVDYKRFGGSLGVGRDLSTSTQMWLHYRLESVHASYPVEASHLRGYDREPIDFDVIRGRSVLSTLRGTLQVDTRDHPFLPTRGWFATVTAEVGLLPAALDYDYQRLDVQASRWWKLPWHDHVLRLELFAGAISGDAPFFEQYHIGDFSDFRPDRVLGINFDRRPPPNFLSTEIAEVRYGKYALDVGVEYRIPLYRGRRTIFGIDFFGSAGLYSVAAERDLTHSPTGYSGLSRVPVDATGNLGFRMDTSAGGFVFAFSNVLSFIPIHGEGPAGE